MDLRLLTLSEFHKVYFYRLITLLLLVVMSGMTVMALFETPNGEAKVFALFMLLITGRFTVEWFWVKRSLPVLVHGDELMVTGLEHRRIPLTQVRSVTSRHAIFMTRRYRSWSEHLAFIELTLNNGERVTTLSESGVFDFPAGKETLATLRAMVLDAKTKSLSASAR